MEKVTELANSQGIILQGLAISPVGYYLTNLMYLQVAFETVQLGRRGRAPQPECIEGGQTSKQEAIR